MNGKGKYKFSDGREYEGDFRDDRFEGQGKLTWPNKSWYNGTWK